MSSQSTQSLPGSNLIELGTISRAHGFRGAFVVASHGGRDSALSYLRSLFIGTDASSAIPHNVITAEWMPKGWKVLVEGIENDQAVRPLQGRTIFANRSELAPTGKNEYYVGDLVGFRAIARKTNDEMGRFVGIESVTAGVEHPQDRWWFETPSGFVALPATKHFIENVDITEGTIWVQNLSDLE